MIGKLVLGAAVIAGLAFATPALATGSDSNGPSFETCTNLKGWYANPDEQSDLPTPTVEGLKFEGKDLIHHATDGIDLADMDKVQGSFVATVSGKVLFKVETSSPYSTIITNPDGKLWSTAMSYDQDGGQGKPVAHYSDLVGKDTKPGKAKYSDASKVVTFGVGYAVEEGSTVVSAVSFHGTNYDLTCKPKASPSTTSPSPSTSTSHTVKPSTSTSTSHTAVGGGAGGGTSAGNLAITGPSTGLLVGLGGGVLAGGVVLLWALHLRRRNKFQA